ncbi:phosphodiester glycosidase family protein [Glaesserella sp.]|uniref:phosphodiester glycosidase family protein n=1 Tax=Glaesserella sp. TaxID=2094731 RepID=UPI0035A0E3B4
MKKSLSLLVILFGLLCKTAFANAQQDCIQTYMPDSYIHVAKIDLNCKNLQVVATDPRDQGMSVSDFAQKYQTDVAINANFYRKDFSPIGLTITNGKVWQKGKDTRARTFFACDAQNKCVIEGKNKLSKTNPKWVTAISGWQYFEQKSGKFECADRDKIGCSQDIFSGKHPRTLLGLDEKNNMLYLVVVEGRQIIYRGMTLNELADLAKKLGLTKAINLDGGGSSAMVVNGKRISELPVLQGSERKVANHFGVKLTDKK